MARAARLKQVSGSARWKWWHGMLGGMLLMLSPGSAMLLLTLSAPALLVMIADTTPRRMLTRTVILFSIAASIEPVRLFLATGHDINASFEVLTRPTTVLFVWLCAGSGWLTTELFCLIATFVAGLKMAAARKAQEALLLQIRTEWQLPEDPAGGP